MFNHIFKEIFSLIYNGIIAHCYVKYLLDVCISPGYTSYNSTPIHSVHITSYSIIQAKLLYGSSRFISITTAFLITCYSIFISSS